MDSSRTELLTGIKGVELLKKARVAVFGLGGVGSYAVEALARAGVGSLLLVDHDRIEPSNLNRQLFALESTIGRAKTEIAVERVGMINPEAEVDARSVYIGPDTIDGLFTPEFHYAIDAIDTISSKVLLLSRFVAGGIPHVSCMGAANRLFYSNVMVADIGKTRHCPLARVVRKKLREMDIHSGVRCVYSEAPVMAPGNGPEGTAVSQDGHARGTISYLCGIMGLTAAAVIINDILAGVR
ncbi:MAG TPA: tRNA threonylcarbamoyladenosine dehydratase [Spirochaetes bacterium]|nr:tRNA threonylcarbamoyladenosine dehydratase [Spirochaetota bacterium]